MSALWKVTALAGGVMLALAACGTGGSSTGNAASTAKLVSGATFTYSTSTSLGSLDPYQTTLNDTFVFDSFLYGTLIVLDANGNVQAQLAEKWSAEGTKKATFTLRAGVTCSDGSRLQASDVAAVMNYLAKPASRSPLLGQLVQPGTTATADDATRTVTITSGKPDPFLVESLGSTPIVCKAALENPKLRAEGKAGSGAYKISEIAQGDHYTAELRTDYAWGPGDWKSNGAGVPAKVTARVVSSPTTAANLLLSGELNSARLSGIEQVRVAARKLPSVNTQLPAELLFNQAAGRPAADLAVRTAIVQALDLAKIGKVLSGDKGEPLRQILQGGVPNYCPGNTVQGNLPATDVAAAKAALDKAGWTVGADGIRAKNGRQLAFVMIYKFTSGQPTAAAELIQEQLKAIGVKVTPKVVDGPAAGNALGTDNWDLLMANLQVNNPYAFVPSFSGAAFPDGGTNFGSAHNAEYDQLTAKAAAMPGKTGCELWNQAEAALVRNVDIVPFYALDTPIFGNRATFTIARFAWSIQMTAN
ncbi:ABC transporter substrate-binding protein [Kribbella solani]|uniref:Peptide/nickel transport system substrate-binding protein n=1 Tax=Kribbella solani TaxID=236067 RepID=A0A841DM69_9ACTN|nr:peptide/nickel transport system substrate-binding protein [Kribbella solani]